MTFENNLTAFPFSRLDEDLLSMVFSCLDRRSARNIMLVNHFMFEQAKPFVWREVIGFDPIYKLLPYIESARPQSEAPVSRTGLSLVQPLTSEVTTRLQVYNKYIEVLDLTKPWYGGNVALSKIDSYLLPLTPRLRKIIVCVSKVGDIGVILGWFCPNSLQNFSITVTKPGNGAVSVPFTLPIFQTFRLEELHVTVPGASNRTAIAQLPMVHLYELLKDLKVLSVGEPTLRVLPDGVVAILPCLNYLRLSKYLTYAMATLPSELNQNKQFPSLERVEFSSSLAKPIRKLLSLVDSPQLQAVCLGITEWDFDGDYKVDIKATIELVARHSDTLRILRLHHEHGVLRLPECCIPLLCQLRGLTEFRSNGFWIHDDDMKALEVFRCWASIEVLDLPAQELGPVALEMLAENCLWLKELVIHFNPSTKQVVYGRDQWNSADHVSRPSGDTLWLKCVMECRSRSLPVQMYTRAIPIEMQRVLLRHWAYIVMTPFDHPDDWVNAKCKRWELMQPFPNTVPELGEQP